MNNLPTLKGTCLLASALLSACQADSEPLSEGRELSITFSAYVRDVPAECGARYSDLGSSAVDAELRNLKWFVSNVELISEDGSSHPLTLRRRRPDTKHPRHPYGVLLNAK